MKSSQSCNHALFSHWNGKSGLLFSVIARPMTAPTRKIAKSMEAGFKSGIFGWSSQPLNLPGARARVASVKQSIFVASCWGSTAWAVFINQIAHACLPCRLHCSPDTPACWVLVHLATHDRHVMNCLCNARFANLCGTQPAIRTTRIAWEYAVTMGQARVPAACAAHQRFAKQSSIGKVSHLWGARPVRTLRLEGTDHAVHQ